MKQRRKKAYAGFGKAMLNLYGPHTLYGPYIRNEDGRAIVVIRRKGKSTTKLYAKCKLEIKLGRKLQKEETVDHKDGNIQNDRFYNLTLLSRPANAYKSAWKRVSVRVKCPQCGARFATRRRPGDTRAGPFCSKSCAGAYGKKVQCTGITIKKTKLKVEYTR